MNIRDKIYAKIKELEIERFLELREDKRIAITHKIDDLYEELDNTDINN